MPTWQLPSKDVNNAGYKVDMMLASVNADFHADKDVTVLRPYYLHLCTGESGGWGPKSNLWSGLFCGPANPSHPTQPTLAREQIQMSKSLNSGAGPVVCFLSSCSDCPQLRYRDLSSHRGKKPRRTWSNFLGVFFTQLNATVSKQ